MIWMMYGHMRLPGLRAFCATSTLLPLLPANRCNRTPAETIAKNNGELADITMVKNTGELLQKTPGKCRKKNSSSSDRENTNLSVLVAQHPHGSSQRRQRLKLGDGEAICAWR